MIRWCAALVFLAAATAAAAEDFPIVTPTYINIIPGQRTGFNVLWRLDDRPSFQLAPSNVATVYVTSERHSPIGIGLTEFAVIGVTPGRVSDHCGTKDAAVLVEAYNPARSRSVRR